MKNETVHLKAPKGCIEIVINSTNPLNNQLLAITGNGWNTQSWTNTLHTNVITHKKTGLQVFVHPKSI